MGYVNKFCYCGTVERFLAVGKDEWLSTMERKYAQVSPHPLTKSLKRSWENCYDSLFHTFSILGDKYRKLYLVFEYGLPMFPVKTGKPVNEEYAINADCIVLSNNSVLILEFKDKDLSDREFSLNLAYSVRRYRNRIQQNHDRSRGFRKKGVLVSTVNTGIRQKRIRGIDLCSSDLLHDEILEYFGPAPVKLRNIMQWVGSTYS